jgi:serine protease Do
MDKEKDLALLQVAVPGKPPLAPLAAKYAVESGDKVVVIGHPGLGQKTLNYTMTTGVVSNPRQTIERQEYLQTNAAVNPGSSGGPVFDAQGNVIALVVLKGDIEGAGFAVPSDRLVAFLHAAVEAKAKRSPDKEK